MAGSNSDGHPILSYQPLKFLFQLTYVASIIARIPLWTVVSFVPFLRPHPKWTAKQTLMARLAYAVSDFNSRIGITESLSLKPGTEGNRFQVITPSAPEFYKGPLQSSTVKPAEVGGTWSPQSPSGSNSKVDVTSAVVALYFHGGAFILGDGRDTYSGYPTKTMVQRGGVGAVFSLQYRLSGYSGLNPFPAALQDALTAYLYLIHTLKISPRQIVLCGDSAGANLAIALLRYINDHGANLDIPQPRCAALVSPWVAPLDYNHNANNNPRWATDFLPSSFLRWGATAYGAGVENAASYPYITPLGNPFSTPVPIFASAGTAEILYEGIKNWVAEMQKAHGNKVELFEEDAAIHDTFLIADKFGWEESAEGVVSAMGEFIRRSG